MAVSCYSTHTYLGPRVYRDHIGLLPLTGMTLYVVWLTATYSLHEYAQQYRVLKTLLVVVMSIGDMECMLSPVPEYEYPWTVRGSSSHVECSISIH